MSSAEEVSIPGMARRATEQNRQLVAWGNTEEGEKSRRPGAAEFI